MRRLIVAALLTGAALAGNPYQANAAGFPLPPRHARAGDYYFYAISCTGTGTTTCASEEAYNDGTAAVGPPSGGFFECDRWNGHQEQYMWVVYGEDSGELGSGTAGGVAGVLSPSSIASNLAGIASASYGPGLGGPVSGAAVGLVRYAPNPSYPPGIFAVTGGKITITLRGTMYVHNFDSGAETTAQGSMTCAIGVSPNDAFVETGP